MTVFDFQYCRPIQRGDKLRPGDMAWGHNAELPVETWDRMTEAERKSFRLAVRNQRPCWFPIEPNLYGRKSDSTLIDWRVFGRPAEKEQK